MRSTAILSLACAAALTAACGGDTRNESSVLDENDPVVGTSGEMLDADDPLTRNAGLHRRFVEEMIASGSAEIQLGQLASQRASHPEVKSFGQKMAEDHTKSGEQLKQIAGTHGITTAAPFDDDHREMIEQLSKLKGPEFDREYMEAMIESHEEMAEKLEDRVEVSARDGAPTGGQPREGTPQPADADSGLERSVNQWAAQTLPAVRGHLDEARALHEKIQSGRNNTASR